MAECKGEVSTHINASAERVWAFVGDLSRHTAWNHQPTSIVKTSNGPDGVGATYHTVEDMPEMTLPMKVMFNVVFRPAMALSGAKGYTEATVTDVEAPQTIAWEAHAPKRKGDMMRARWRLTLVPDAGGTNVSETFEFLPPSRFPGAPPKSLIEAEVARNLATLKRLAEGERAGANTEAATGEA